MLMSRTGKKMVVYRCCDFTDWCRRITSALGHLCLHKSVQHLDCKWMFCVMASIFFCMAVTKLFWEQFWKICIIGFLFFLQSFSNRVPPNVIRKSIRSVQWFTGVLPNSSCIVLVTMFLYWPLMWGDPKIVHFPICPFLFFAQQKKKKTWTFLQRSAFPF